MGVAPPQSRFWIRVVVDVGWNHVVKKLLHAVGLQVTKLHRQAIGPLCLVLGEDSRARWPEEVPNPSATLSTGAGAAAAAGGLGAVVLETEGSSRQLTAGQVAGLWAAVGGRAAATKLQACQLLCRYRHTVAAGMEDLRRAPPCWALWLAC